VDKTRVNEFGQSFEHEADENASTKKQLEQPKPKEEEGKKIEKID
jgi:hypothetical protein